MDYLQTRHLIVSGSRRDLLTNHLALIALADSKVRLRIAPEMPIAAALGSGRLAVAGPEVPAGKYGREALTKLGVFDSVKDKLAPAQNVRAALAFVAQGASPLGIVYDTDARIEPKVKIVALFPDSSHAAIVYPAALVGGVPQPRGRGVPEFPERRESKRDLPQVRVHRTSLKFSHGTAVTAILVTQRTDRAARLSPSTIRRNGPSWASRGWPSTVSARITL